MNNLSYLQGYTQKKPVDTSTEAGLRKARGNDADPEPIDNPIDPMEGIQNETEDLIEEQNYNKENDMNKLSYLIGYMEKKSAKVDKLITSIPLEDLASKHPQLMRYLLDYTINKGYSQSMEGFARNIRGQKFEPEGAAIDDALEFIRRKRKNTIPEPSIHNVINRNQAFGDKLEMLVPSELDDLKAGDLRSILEGQKYAD